jgi:DNA-binding MarR family transcriptional regulator
MEGKSDPYVTIHRFFRRLQQRNRYVGEHSLAESHLLIELDSRPGMTASDLNTALNIEQSTLSRLLMRLTEQGLIVAKADQKDSRRKLLRLSAQGSALVDKIDREVNTRLVEYASAFSAREAEELAGYWNILADGLGVQPIMQRKADTLFRVGQRRVTRGLGLYGRSFMGLDVTPTQWHIIAEIAESPAPRNLMWLSERLGLAHNSISQMVKRLESVKVLKRARGDIDARNSYLSVTEKGRALWIDIEERARLKIRGALTKLTAAQLKRFVELFRRFIEPFEDSHGFQLKVIRGQTERSAARAFLMEQLVSQNMHHDTPESLVGSSDLSVSAEIRGELCGVFQLRPEKRQIILTCAALTPKLTKDERAELWGYLQPLVKNEGYNSEILVQFPPFKSQVPGNR